MVPLSSSFVDTVGKGEQRRLTLQKQTDADRLHETSGSQLLSQQKHVNEQIKRNIDLSKNNVMKFKNVVGDQENPVLLLSNDKIISSPESGSFDFYRLEHSVNKSSSEEHNSESSESMNIQIQENFDKLESFKSDVIQSFSDSYLTTKHYNQLSRVNLNDSSMREVHKIEDPSPNYYNNASRVITTSSGYSPMSIADELYSAGKQDRQESQESSHMRLNLQKVANNEQSTERGNTSQRRHNSVYKQSSHSEMVEEEFKQFSGVSQDFSYSAQPTHSQ